MELLDSVSLLKTLQAAMDLLDGFEKFILSFQNVQLLINTCDKASGSICPIHTLCLFVISVVIDLLPTENS